MANLIKQTKDIMVQTGRVMPIWVTEAGIPTNDPPVAWFHNYNSEVFGATKYNLYS